MQEHVLACQGARVSKPFLLRSKPCRDAGSARPGPLTLRQGPLMPRPRCSASSKLGGAVVRRADPRVARRGGKAYHRRCVARSPAMPRWPAGRREESGRKLLVDWAGMGGWGPLRGDHNSARPISGVKTSALVSDTPGPVGMNRGIRTRGGAASQRRMSDDRVVENHQRPGAVDRLRELRPLRRPARHRRGERSAHARA